MRYSSSGWCARAREPVRGVGLRLLRMAFRVLLLQLEHAFCVDLERVAAAVEEGVFARFVEVMELALQVVIL